MIWDLEKLTPTQKRLNPWKADACKYTVEKKVTVKMKIILMKRNSEGSG